jgi:hypothetical protein
LKNHLFHFGCGEVGHFEHFAAAEADRSECLLVGLGLSRARLPADADHLHFGGDCESIQDVKHEGVNVRLVLSDVFFPHVDRLEVVREAFSGIVLWHGLERIDDDKTVPQARVDLLLS